MAARRAGALPGRWRRAGRCVRLDVLSALHLALHLALALALNLQAGANMCRGSMPGCQNALRTNAADMHKQRSQAERQCMRTQQQLGTRAVSEGGRRPTRSPPAHAAPTGCAVQQCGPAGLPAPAGVSSVCSWRAGSCGRRCRASGRRGTAAPCGPRRRRLCGSRCGSGRRRAPAAARALPVSPPRQGAHGPGVSTPPFALSAPAMHGFCAAMPCSSQRLTCWFCSLPNMPSHSLIRHPTCVAHFQNSPPVCAQAREAGLDKPKLAA